MNASSDKETELVELRDYIKIDINNVAIWVQKEVDEDAFDWDKWIGTIISPIEKAYFTYHVRRAKYYVGVIVNVVNIEDGEFNEALKEQGKAEIDPRAKWVMAMDCYYSNRADMSVSGEMGSMTLLLDENGCELKSKYYRAPEHVMSMGKDAVGDSRFIVKVILIPVLVAISLMHCKNIELVNKPITRAQRRRVKRTGKPLVVEKVLVIEPFKRKVINETSGGHTGLTLAMHICRGHFREYSEEKPLFGKYSGKYWIPQHARGNKESGTVDKEYEIDISDG